jgi:hypothetical protein
MSRSLVRRSPLFTLADNYFKFGFHYERGFAMVKKILLAVFCTLAVHGGQQVMGQDSVRGYTRSNGTYVAPYVRSQPDHNYYNNWSTYPNINPYTGKTGTHVTPSYSPSSSYLPKSSYPSYPSYSSPSPSYPSYSVPSYSPSYVYPK